MHFLLINAPELVPFHPELLKDIQALSAMRNSIGRFSPVFESTIHVDCTLRWTISRLLSSKMYAALLNLTELG